jgi:hypothetical protein
VLSTLRQPLVDASAGSPGPELADALFTLVTSREFCYLGRRRTEPYRAATTALIARRVERGEPLRFFYDIGPGYHASLDPDTTGLGFDVGLAELLILRQIAALAQRVAAVYPPGVRFWLVIDNICGLRTNDVPLERTQAYSRQLRTLVAETRLADLVDLVVESEKFDLAEYDRLLAQVEPAPAFATPSTAELENVERFLGRRCTVDEAAARIERYRRAGIVTDLLLDRLVSGVHMTQRATAATLGFRPFPGGDVRTQCGVVALTPNGTGGVRPLLVTSRNAAAYTLRSISLPELLPSPLVAVPVAQPALGVAAASADARYE